MYGINEYLMVMSEVEKARLARQARKGSEKPGPSPTGSPPSAKGRLLKDEVPVRGRRTRSNGKED